MYSKIRNVLLQHRFESLMILVVVVLIFSAIFFTISQQHPENVQEVPASQSNAQNNPPHINANNPTLPQVETQTYAGATYHIAFPQTWTEDVNADSDFHGTMLTLKPDTSNPDENAHVAVEITSARDNSLASMSAGLSLLGFHKSYTTVQEIAAQKFTGTVTLSQKMLHNTIYLFSYHSQIYLIKLSYQGSATDAQLEEEFTQSINTFAFN
jgi:hypothetical protein